MLTGVFAAVPTPVDDGGRVDWAAFDRLVQFLNASGVDGLCVGGATSEYPCFEVHERAELIRRAAAQLPIGRRLIAGIGAGAMSHTVSLGTAAFGANAAAVLVPPPFFFPYEQQDLAAFFRHVGDALGGRCVLYNLPAFTTPIATETMIELLRADPHIIGVKDSSGEARRIQALAAARGGADWSLFVGDDLLLRSGVQAGWTGSISGIAAFCPELIVDLFRSATAGRGDEAARCEASLKELVSRMTPFPITWAIRTGLRARGIDIGMPTVPLSASRLEQLSGFERWLQGWLPDVT